MRAGNVKQILIHSFGLIMAVVSVARAEQLPIKTYTTADGLPVDLVKRIKRDSHGFLWFCTRDGLSKFDGYQFTTYGKEQGLPHPYVNDLIQSRDGTYWVATNGGGACNFNPAQRAPSGSASRFKVYSLEYNPSSNIVNRLCEDRQGRVWAGTDGGLFYFDKAQDRFIAAVPDAVEIYSLLADREGVLWIGASNQLWRRSPEGQLVRYSFQVGRDLGRIFSLLEDDKGKLWVGSRYAGLFELDPQRLPLEDSALKVDKTKALLNHHTVADGVLTGAVEDLYQSRDGHIWIVATPVYTTSLGGGLFEFDGKRFRRYGKAQGLTSDQLRCLAEDSDGNLWLGSLDGAMKIARNGFTTFGESDGLHRGPNAIFENKSGELCVITEAGMVINRFEGGRFISTRLNVPKAVQNSKRWGSLQITFQDRAGEWWVPTSKGLMRFPGVARVEQLAHARPKAHYLLEGDLDRFDIFRLFEDSRGDIWIGLGSGERNLLLKWERATERFHYYTEADGVPPLNPPTSFCEDAHGNLWIGFYSGGLLRYREGRFTLFGIENGLPSGFINHLYLDQSGRLWVASSSDGVGRIDDTSAECPAFVRHTAANGLSSNVVYSITEDLWGRIYIGTFRSVDRINPATGNIKRYTAADGLPKGGAQLAFRDASGALWFGGIYEIARLVPKPDEQLLAPPVLITGLRVAGIPQPIADLGEIEVRGLELGPSQNHFQIEFVGLAFGAGETLQYQYRLEGADRDWQQMTALRTVNYANLAPGAYRFLVRAMSAEGVFSQSTASLEFSVLAPLWRRWWFLALATLAVAVAVYADLRKMVGRRLVLERVRLRIASDLHDDIGSSLSQIAVLSEVLRKQLGAQEARISKNLSLINRVSQEALDSMSDIVWAINPQQDHLSNLVRRMRRVASEVLPARNIEFKFNAPTAGPDLKLGADIRRQVFLMFKEAINNMVRHSECTRAEIELKIEGAWLALAVADNGKGFDPDQVDEGNGLVSLRRRARSLGGKTDVSSRIGEGTTITVRIPHSHQRFPSLDVKP
jgi:ligand-binding sensor domain-containing protein/signal transduction histidine kinase